MRIVVYGKNMDVSDDLKNRITKKVSKLSRYFKEDVEAQIRMSVQNRGRHTVEITIPFYGDLLRAEEVTNDMYVSIDRALSKLERQIHKHRQKFEQRMREGAFYVEEPEFSVGYDDLAESLFVSRVKSFSTKPLTVEEAITQMDMLGHSFFVFVNAELDRTCVIYRRNDGQIGLLQPDDH